ncbi:MAG: glutamine amidotransferase [Synergistaceae bacterium]|jgi:uncharacterized membrane protein|nr:glutamine amidotransferase [Synergistaceae bacterium]
MKVLYAGDACTKVGPVFIASPFNLEVKGVSHHIWGQPLIDALGKNGIEVKHLTNDQAISEFPRTVEDLSEYDALIISDCEAEVLSLYPFWIPGTPLPRTDRLRAVRDYVKGGGGLLMIGGWSSFSGRFGTAAYYDTPIEEALPVNCLKGADDRVEVPAGVRVKVQVKDHPILKDIPWDEAPVFEGFNKIIPKEGSTVLATIGDEEIEYPLLVTWRYGSGRSAAFSSDCSPHWAEYFQPWEYYGQFWVQVVRWLGAK